MELSPIQLQAKLMREYYQYFSKYTRGKMPRQKIAWVTAFTPVEILDALDISYFYPESYAAVIAASGKEQPLLEESERCFLCRDCCSYACCIEGSLSSEQAPRGMPPKPDVLIATNNQCDTLPNWWNILAQRYQVPLIVLDYPGEACNQEKAFAYVTAQHQDLIKQMERLSGNRFTEEALSERIENSRRSVKEWEHIISLFPHHEISPTFMFDTISFLITSRCKSETVMLYQMLVKELELLPPADPAKLPLFWLGYPLWYHPKRYMEELLNGCRIAGSNYVTWWNLDYRGEEPLEQLFHAYNETFLNLTPETKKQRLTKLIEDSKAKGAIVLRNKSCKCDFVSAQQVGIPQAELEIDMIDREFLDVKRAQAQISLLVDNLCIS